MKLFQSRPVRAFFRHNGHFWLFFNLLISCSLIYQVYEEGNTVLKLKITLSHFLMQSE
jgi:hypothetical protein